jgi:hypothetical protein
MMFHSSATTLDLSSVAEGERNEVASLHIAKSIIEGRYTVLTDLLTPHSDLDQYGPREPHSEFVQRLCDSGVLVRWRPPAGLPVELYYFNGRPLVGFLLPEFSVKAAHGVEAITVSNVVLNADEMPAMDDKRRLGALVAYALLKSAISAVDKT